MEKSELISLLEALPAEHMREYEIRLTDLSNSEHASRIIGSLLEIVEDRSLSEKACYNAFYCLTIIYRHLRNYEQLDALINRNKSRFQSHITFNHLLVMLYIEGEYIYDYNEILSMTYEDTLRFPDNAGYVHMFASVYASIYESGGIRNEHLAAFADKWYDMALAAAERAIQLDPAYAKYYCTRGRVLLSRNKFAQAERDINSAISRENSNRIDYALRIATYQYYKAIAVMSRRTCELEERLTGAAGRERLSQDAVRQAEALEPYAGEAPYVFISYDHDDSPRVYDILLSLKERRVRYWIDRGGIPANCDYSEFIAGKIDRCSAVIFMVSPRSVDSQYVRKEIKYAIDRDKRPICLFLENTSLTPGMQMQLGGHQYINAYEMSGERCREMLLSCLPQEVMEGDED